MSSSPRSARTAARSSPCSAACVCTSMPRSWASAALSRMRRSLHDRMNRGEATTRTRGCFAQARSSASSRRRFSSVGTARRAGMPSDTSMSAGPLRARSPNRSMASSTTSWPYVVPMSRMVVVPPRSSSSQARARRWPAGSGRRGRPRAARCARAATRAAAGRRPGPGTGPGPGGRGPARTRARRRRRWRRAPGAGGARAGSRWARRPRSGPRAPGSGPRPPSSTGRR